MLRRLSIVLALVAVTISMSACHQALFVTSRAPGVVRTANLPYFVGGLIGVNQVDVAAMCPNGVSRIETITGVMDGVLTFFTGGLYSPRTLVVTCAAGSAKAPARVYLGMDEQGQILQIALEEANGAMSFRQVAEVSR